MAKVKTAPKTELEQTLEEMVVFIHPVTGPFSMDRRWNDRQVREAWIDANIREEEPEEDEVEVEDEEIVDERPYPEWTNDELRAELSNRQLSVEGTKAQLVARLKKDDEENPSE